MFGSPFKDFSSKQLRTVCSRLKLKGVKNVTKIDMLQRLVEHHNNWKNYYQLQNQKRGDSTSPRKQVQCSFCLLNILFSDQFAPLFASLGDVATRQILDSGKAANDEHFWVGVQQAFVTPHPEYDQLFFDDDEILAANDINPGNIVEHNWKKLRMIWKALNVDYKAALTRFTVSGTHDNNFYNFCGGKLDVYYLRKQLEL